ncbi:DUF2779 domain-containing protein [Nitrospira sp. Kam-Ns4a]
MVPLTKSKVLAGLQCLKRVFLEIRAPDLARPPDDATRALLATGTEVGRLARRRFPGGRLVEPHAGRREEAVRRTAELLRDPGAPAIFEAAFEHHGVFVRVDILERVARGTTGELAWRLIEVKASARVKEVHLDDLAIQTSVVRAAGVRLAGVWLMHVNTDYRLGAGPLDLERYFALEEVTEAVEARCARIQARLAEVWAALGAAEPPAVEPGPHCHRPYDCPFWAHCTKDKPARWIFRLSDGGRELERLAASGVQTIDDLPPGTKLTPLQRRMKENVEWIGPGLRAALRSVRYPVHHLDIEAVGLAVPRFPGTSPFEPVPVQWSDHIEEEDGTIRHEGYLCTEPRDPREEFAESLLACLGGTGSICVYSGSERDVLERLGEAVPRLKRDLDQVLIRLWDLLAVIQDQYYHPAFNGSLSVKAVLHALAPDLRYDRLEIRDGATAARRYEEMVFEETDWVEKERIRAALLEYCRQDTLALLRIRKELWARAALRAG